MIDANLLSSSVAYLATPYTLYPGGVREAFEEAARLVAHLLFADIPAYSPVVHFHSVKTIGQLKLTFENEAVEHEYWMGVNAPMMRACGYLIVAHMPSWETSKGVAGEIDFFKWRGRPIYDLDWQAAEIGRGFTRRL